MRTLLLILLVLPVSAQVKKLHTRDLTRLSQVQVADVLKKTDIIFIPVGAVETNGTLPSGRDYVYPLAYAMAMAEETGGLYMPGLVWSYPGTTLVAPSTIYTSPHKGAEQLQALARSLLRQGFRRQVYLSASHGPAPLTVGTLVREFFDETHVPILYINMDTYLPRLKLTKAQQESTLWGSHFMTGRLEDLPLQGEYGAKESMPAGPVPVNEGLATLGKLGFSGSLSLGSFVADPMAHGVEIALPKNPTEREQWGRRGVEQIRDIVKQMRLPEAMEALRKHDRFTQEVIVPKFGTMLPTPAEQR